MGYGSVLVETAALGFADGRVRQAEGVVPMVDHEDLPGVVRAAAPLTDVDPWQMTLLPAHPRALYRAVVQRMVRLAVLFGIVAWIVDPLGLWAFLGLVLLRHWRGSTGDGNAGPSPQRSWPAGDSSPGGPG